MFGKQQGERGAFSGSALNLYLAPVGFGDLAGYGEPQPRSARRPRGISPIETLEYERQLILGDPNPGVRDLQLGPAVFLSDAHRHLAPLRGVPDGVVQQYGGRLLETAPVEEGVNRMGWAQVLDGDLCPRRAPGRPGGFFGDGREVVVLSLQGRALVAAGEGQQALRQLLHTLRF